MLRRRSGGALDCRHWLHAAWGAVQQEVEARFSKGAIGSGRLFQPAWYHQQNGDVRAKGIDALFHYWRFGAYEGRDPSPVFDTEWYRHIHLGDCKHRNPLLHYLKNGRHLGLRPHPAFDAAWYAAQLGTVTSREALEHFLSEGGAAGLPPNAEWADELSCEEAQVRLSPPERGKLYFDTLSKLADVGDWWTAMEVRRALRLARQNLGSGSRSPLVSIITPVFNRESLIGEAIKSVLDQTYSNFELIVCDDGSSDGTVDVIETFAKHDDRVTVLRNKSNDGAAAARNRCLQQAKGDYFAYIDSDNIWHPQFLTLMVKALESDNGVSFAYCSYFDVVIGESGLYARPTRYRDFSYELQMRNPYIDLNSLVHRSGLLQSHGGFDPRLRMLQDYDLIGRYTAEGGVKHVSIALNIYRRIRGLGQLSDGDRAEALSIINAKQPNGQNGRHGQQRVAL
jgi:hypothetical protein